MESSPLRVAIFPYIPDLAGDELAGLRQYIADQFKSVTGLKVEVYTKGVNPYDLDALQSTYLTDGKDAYDLMEVDTVLLGELVEAGLLQPLDGYEPTDVFAPSAVHSVTYSGHVYGVPTLQCANFLMELKDKERYPKLPLLNDWSSFDQLKNTLKSAEAKSGHKIPLVGNFRGSWVLPMFYLDAYIDKHGKGSVYEGINAEELDQDLIGELKVFTDFGKLPDGKNPGTDPKVRKGPNWLVEEVVDTKHVLMYSYSESMCEALQKAAEKKGYKQTLRIVSPPLDKYNLLLTYTDAVVVNKSKFKSSDSQRAAVIKKFVEFYTSLDFRTKFAFGNDLPPSVFYPRYVLPARKAFFTETDAANDEYYKQFHDALQHSVAAPNHKIYSKRKALQKKLETALGMN